MDAGVTCPIVTTAKAIESALSYGELLSAENPYPRSEAGRRRPHRIYASGTTGKPKVSLYLNVRLLPSMAIWNLD